MDFPYEQGGSGGGGLHGTPQYFTVLDGFPLIHNENALPSLISMSIDASRGSRKK